MHPRAATPASDLEVFVYNGKGPGRFNWNNSPGTAYPSAHNDTHEYAQSAAGRDDRLIGPGPAAPQSERAVMFGSTCLFAHCNAALAPSLHFLFPVFTSFNKLSEAAEACASIGSTLATAAQLESAWALGAEWCFCAAVSSGQWSFPMHRIAGGCGNTMSVFKGCTAGGATCYGRKPRKGSIKGLLPFSPARYHAPGVTPPGPPNYGDNEGRHRYPNKEQTTGRKQTVEIHARAAYSTRLTIVDIVGRALVFCIFVCLSVLLFSPVRPPAAACTRSSQSGDSDAWRSAAGLESVW